MAGGGGVQSQFAQIFKHWRARLPRWVCDQRIDRIQEMPKCVEPTLRANGVDDAEILATDTEPHAEADARLEAAQLAETGIVYAPAADVKGMMRLLVLDAGATVQ